MAVGVVWRGFWRRRVRTDRCKGYLSRPDWSGECSNKRELCDTTRPPTAFSRSREMGAGQCSDGAEGCKSRLGQVRGRNRLEGSRRSLDYPPHLPGSLQGSL